MGDICLYPDEAYTQDSNGTFVKQYRLLVVTRDMPGYIPSKYGYFSTEALAWKKAYEENMDMGVYTREEVMEIVESSIAAQDLRDGTDLLGRA